MNCTPNAIPRLFITLFLIGYAGCGRTTLSGVSPIAVYPAELDFGPVPEGSTATKAISVSNIGRGALHITAARKEGSSEEFQVLTFEVEINEGSEAQVVVSFTPGEAGSDEGMMVLDSDDPGKPKAEVKLRAGPIWPKIDTSPNPVSFSGARERTVTSTTLIKNGGLAVALAKIHDKAVAKKWKECSLKVAPGNETAKVIFEGVKW